MCGITGVFNFGSRKPVDKDQLKMMCDILVHRGPDEEGIYLDEINGVGLGHRRLSIIDLSSGQQPMSDSNKSIWITYNGEIYNYPELKSELIAKGHKFLTNSDTEVILYLYKEFGEKGFHRLNGIFAFAIYDKSAGTIILARDHFGVKPLYYTITNDKLIFSSEIKSILLEPSIRKEIDFEALNSFLTFRFNPAPQTLFRGIKKLPQGNYLKVNLLGQVKLDTYWEYIPATNQAISEQEAIYEYQTQLENAVKRQIISDVPVGLLLSGGIDSAVIGKLMQNYSKEKIKTFTIGFEGNGEFNELVDAKVTAKFIDSEHYEITISQQEYMDFFSKSFYYTEEPVAYTTIPALYYVSKLASEHVKVVLAGQGADEPLAGYKRYFGEKYLNLLYPYVSLLPIETLSKLLPRNERVKRAAFASQFSNQIEKFLAIHTIFTPDQKAHLLKDELKTLITNNDIDVVKSLYDKSCNLTDSLSKLLFIDTRLSLPDNLLLFGDKMSMANSLEMRVPFLDVELIKFLETLPSKFKLKGFTHKYLHKKALAKWLPQSIVKRTKRGFSTPMDNWLQNDLSTTAKELFNEKNSAAREFFNIRYIDRMIELHQAKRENYVRHLFAILSFELWYRQFFQSSE